MDQPKRKLVESSKAAQPIGPYSLGVRFDRLVFTSGQVGIDPATGELAEGGVEAETRQALNNLKDVLEAGGSSLAQVLKTTVFMADMAEFPRMNAVYGEFFPAEPPARSTVEVAALPKGAKVEIEAVAVRPAGQLD